MQLKALCHEHVVILSKTYIEPGPKITKGKLDQEEFENWGKFFQHAPPCRTSIKRIRYEPKYGDDSRSPRKVIIFHTYLHKRII